MKKEKLFTIVKFLFPLLLLIFAVFELKKFIGNIDLGLLQTEIDQLRIGTLLLIFDRNVRCSFTNVTLRCDVNEDSRIKGKEKSSA